MAAAQSLLPFPAMIGTRIGLQAQVFFMLAFIPTTRTSAGSASAICDEGALGIIVETLPSLQASRGGFGKPPNLLATQRALFLAELYGVRINHDKAREFVAHALASPVPDEDPPIAESSLPEHKKVEQEKAGKESGTPHMMMFRSVDDLFAAILCSQSLGLEQHLPDTSMIMAFLLSLFDQATGLFAKTPAASGDVRSSAVAMQVAEWLGENPYVILRAEGLVFLVHNCHLELNPPGLKIAPASTSTLWTTSRRVFMNLLTTYVPAGKRHELSQQCSSIRAVLHNCSNVRHQTASACYTSHLALFDVPRHISRGLSPVSVNYFAVVLAQQCNLHITMARREAMAADLAGLQNLDRLSPKYGGGM